MKQYRALLVIVAAGGVCGAAEARLSLEPIAAGLSEPIYVTAPPGETARIFIVEKVGTIRIRAGAAMLQAPFLDITDRVFVAAEQGLLGMVFHPDYAANGYFYLNYLINDGGTITVRISRFTAVGAPSLAIAADPDSELILLSIPQFGGDHNGGQLHFGPDGFLYIPLGDGGCCNDPQRTGQDPFTLLGKILRIDVNGASPGKNYAIPPGNPFAGIELGLEEIWALGVRNPFTSGFDRATGDLYFGDVGQDALEEISIYPAGSPGGLNFGWPVFEGTRCNVEAAAVEDCAGLSGELVFPVHEFEHGPLGFSIIGGRVYRGAAIPEIQGRYFFSDFVSRRIWSFRWVEGAVTEFREHTFEIDPDSVLQQVVAISEDAAGELYFTCLTGEVYRLFWSPQVDLDPIMTGLDSPVYVTQAPGAAGRLHIVEQPGAIRLFRNGAVQPAAFLDLSDRTNYNGAEMGLLGLAFHPAYANNGRFYVNYTAGTEGVDLRTVVSEFRAIGDPATADTADIGSEVIKLTFAQPYVNHNGGMLAFGPDGYLYIASGDGGDANDPEGRAQDLAQPLGKILRVNVDTEGLAEAPPDNPLLGVPEAHPAVWAYGLRNPWRFSFDRLTGDFWIADVGQYAREEINVETAGFAGGRNYGWRVFEGTRCNTDAADPAECAALAGTAAFPLFEYDHERGDGAVVGGYVYRGPKIPGLRGTYFFADFISGRVYTLRNTNGIATQFLNRTRQLDPNGDRLVAPVSFGEDADGDLFLVDLSGTIFEIIPKGPIGEGEGQIEGEGAVEGEGETENEVALAPSRDATLYESLPGNTANGAGEALFAGRTGGNAGGALRRALLHFDIAAGLPPRAVVREAELRLTVTKTPIGAFATQFTLHRARAAWSEGASNPALPEGSGAPAQPGDATWLHSHFDSALWNAPGGDFEAEASAGATINALGEYGISSAQMAAEVNAWAASPEENFGWFLLGDESVQKSARRFASREHGTPASRPRLILRFVTPGADGVHSADRNADGRIRLSELLRVIQFYNAQGYGCDLPFSGTEDGYRAGAGDETCAPHDSDFDAQDWRITLAELLRLIQLFNSGGYAACAEGEDGFCPA